jgi:hypothetical protein
MARLEPDWKGFIWILDLWLGKFDSSKPGTLLRFSSFDASSTEICFTSSLTEFGSRSASKWHKNLFPALSFTHTMGSVFKSMVLLPVVERIVFKRHHFKLFFYSKMGLNFVTY